MVARAAGRPVGGIVSPRGKMMWLYGAMVWLCGTAVLPHAVAAPLAAQEEPPRISGRVVDLDTGAGVVGAAIVLMSFGGEAADSLRAEAVTDGVGLFRFERAGPGAYELAVTHIAYGTFREQLTLSPGDRLAVRVTLSPAAIELDPVVVEVEPRDRRSARALGTARRRVTAEQLAPVARTGNHLVNALAQLLPGIRVRSGRSQPGELVCLEFRGTVSFAQPGCMTPIVIVDNVRQANGLVTLNTLPLTDIQSVEAVPPAEAGVRFGADSNAGVIVIETISGAAVALRPDSPPGGLYNWSLESGSYPWGKALALATAANAAGLLAGYAISKRCLDFETLAKHFYEAECGFLANAGSRLAFYGAPQVGVGFVAARVGGTDLSQGSMWRNAVASAILSAPGVVLALTSDEDGFSGSRGLGIIMASVAAPAAAVLADRLFRRVKSG